MNKNLKYLNEALRHYIIAERMTYSTFSLINDKKLLLKVLEEIQKSIINSINILNKNILFLKEIKPEMNKKIIKILKKSNFENDDIEKVIKILEINKKHKESAIEFVRKEKVVIMMDNLKLLTLDINEIKEYIKLAKKIYIKASVYANK